MEGRTVRLRCGERAVKRCSAMFCFALMVLLSLSIAAQSALPGSNSQAVTSGANFAQVDEMINATVARGTIPGGVLVVGHKGKVVYRKAYGMRSLEPDREAMTADTIFDLASLTKCIATTSSVMKLVEQGKIRLNNPVASYLPEFAKNGKGDITIRELMTHYSGLREDLDLKTPWKGRETAYQMAMNEKPIFPAGSRFLYSDINFITLGFIVEKVSGMSLDEYAAKNIFAPLGMTETSYLPPAAWLPRIAPTEYDENHHMLRGVVHDPTARRMGGVAGHAGLFSTADDLSKFAEELLSGFHVLSQLTVEKMTTPQQPPTASSLRGLGWDIDSPFSSNRGDIFPIGSFGHTGFTGTSIWIDPVTDSYVILLTNAVHPHGHNSGIVALRARVASTAAQSLGLTVSGVEKLRLARLTGYNEAMTAEREVTARNGSVRNGIDVLEAHGFAELREAGATKTKIALVTNHTGVDQQGARTLVAIVGSRQARLAREIEKLALECGPGAHLDADGVAERVGRSAERKAWTLADAVVARDSAAATRIYLALRSQGERVESLTYWLTRRLREALGVAARLEAGAPPSALRGELRMPPKAATAFIADVARTDVGSLRRAIAVLADLELDSRGGSTLDADTLAVRALGAIAA